MIVWVHGLGLEAMRELEAWVARGYPKLLAGTSFAPGKELPADEFFALAGVLGPKLLEIAERHGAPLAASGRNLKKHFDKALANRYRERHEVYWNLERVFEQALCAAAERRATLRVPHSAESFFVSFSELTEKLFLRQRGAVRLPAPHGMRSAFATLDAKPLWRLLARARKPRSYERVLEATTARNIWKSATHRYTKDYEDARALHDELVALLGPLAEAGLTLVARSSFEDRSYE
jgi:hypothetical protein